MLKLPSIRRSVATLGALAALASAGVTGLVGAQTQTAHAANGAPVTGFSPTPSGNGYWPVASDGDVVDASATPPTSATWRARP